MKYNISSDFKYIKLLTFPIIKAFAPIAEVVLGVFTKINHSDNTVNVTKHKINVGDSTIDALLYEPKKCSDSCPALVYYHGGGFIYKAAPYHYKLVKQYAIQTPCKVLMVDYRLTPKNTFPIQVNDCYHGLEWLIDNSEKLNINKEKTAVAGDSAGGNLASVVALMARDKGLINLCGQMLIYPVIDKSMGSKTMEKYTDTPIWNSKLSEKMWNLYVPKNTNENSAYISPILAKNLANLPKTYIETAQFDCLHDEGVEYADALKNAGNKVKLFETEGTIHGFDMAAKSQITITSIERRINYLKNIFQL